MNEFVTRRRTSDFATDRMRLWQRWFGEPLDGGYGWRPSTDLYEVDGGILIQVEVAGLGGEDFTVHCSGRLVSVFGERRGSGARKPLRCHLVEIASGRFRTDVELPWSVDPERVEIDYAEGIVSIFLPRSAQSEG